MAEFDFKCPNCGKTLRGDEAHQGKKTTCPACKTQIVIPVKETPPAVKVIPEPAADVESYALPHDEKPVLQTRPTLLLYMGSLALAILVPVAVLVILVLINDWTAVSIIFLGIGFFIGLCFFLYALYRKYSIQYKLTTQRFFVIRGLISRKIEELELFRVKDVQSSQKVFERLLNFGTLTIFSTDETSPKFEVAGIADPLKMKDIFRTHFRNARRSERVRPTEFISDFEKGEGYTDIEPGF